MPLVQYRVYLKHGEHNPDSPEFLSESCSLGISPGPPIKHPTLSQAHFSKHFQIHPETQFQQLKSHMVSDSIRAITPILWCQVFELATSMWLQQKSLRD